MVLKRIICITILLAMICVHSASALTYSGGGEWAYSQKVTIEENSGSTLTNYQVAVELNSSNFNFSRALSEGEDIRFTSGEKQLQHWIEEWNTNRQVWTVF